MVSVVVENVSLCYPTSLKAVSKTEQDPSPTISGELVADGLGSVSLKALNDVSVSLSEGDRLGIIGSNGSGKTTLLRVMAGMYAPTTGKVTVDGRVSTMFSMGVGMNMQASGYRNIVISGIVSGATRRQIKAVIPEIEEFTGLGDYLNLPMHTYSQGMAMRLKFACVTAFQPQIVLLDEWIGAGDEEFQAKAEKRLRSLLERSGIVVLATHNIQLMKNIANKVLWLEKGHVMGIGDTNEILDKRGAMRRAAREKRH